MTLGLYTKQCTKFPVTKSQCDRMQLTEFPNPYWTNLFIIGFGFRIWIWIQDMDSGYGFGFRIWNWNQLFGISLLEIQSPNPLYYL
jgi:hypothetical protein